MFVLIGVLWLSLTSLVHASSVDDDFLFLEYLEQKKEISGRATQTFALRFNGPELDFLDVFFQKSGDQTIYQAQVENRSVSISSNQSALFRGYCSGWTQKPTLCCSKRIFPCLEIPT